MRSDLSAAQTWDRDETLEHTNRRIHDGVSGDAALLARANGYVADLLFGNFPQAVPAPGAQILEIGSGVGWIMQALAGYLAELDAAPERIVGLDIAPSMSAKARERLGDRPPFGFQVYDGISVPLADGSFDLVYSVACLQHIPRPFVFNLLFEIKRLLKPGGFAVLHLMSTAALPAQEVNHPWRTEISNQVSEREAHWHHFYTSQELRDVAAITGFAYVAVRDDGGGTLVLCVANTPLQLPADFDPALYLTLNEDLRRGGAEPIQHYLEHGHAEGRRWFHDRRRVARDPAVAQAGAAIGPLVAELRKAKLERDGLRAERDSLARDLAEIRRSTSWRLTAPLRRLVTRVRAG